MNELVIVPGHAVYLGSNYLSQRMTPIGRWSRINS